MNRVDQFLTDRLADRAAAGNLRRLPADLPGIDFRSNDYLGFAKLGLLTGSPAATLGSGATGSRLISGNSKLLEDTEATIADFHRAQAALIFNSGYDANTGLLQAISGRSTTIIYDELCHASIHDGIRLGIFKQKYHYPHNDLTTLETLLQKHHNTGPTIVFTEAIFSMDGDTAPLPEIVALCDKYNSQLIVDEAHATGIIGTNGQGLTCSLGLQDRVYARIHTFGKALGCHGAVVVGSRLLIQSLVNFARSFIYTTALPAHSIQAISNAYVLLAAPGFSNQPLHNLIALFRSSVASAGITGMVHSLSPIQALISGGNENATTLAERLRSSGLLVNAILHPTVPAGSERLRICLHSYNTPAEIALLIKKLTS